MSKKRLHPIAIVLNAIRQLRELLFPFVLFILFGSRGTNGDLFYLIVSGASIGFILISGFLTWYRYTYWIEEDELRIEYGLFVRKKRYIPFDRIQSLDVSEGILQRIFGLVKLKVETAGSGGAKDDAEASLTAITKLESDKIQKILASYKQGFKVNEVERNNETPLREEVLYKITPTELVLLATTSGGVGVVISAVAAFLFQFEEIIPYEKIFKGFETFLENGVVFISVLIFVVLLIAWLIALIGTMLNYANFTLRKVEDDLIISRGLLEKRQLTIPLHRIQAVRITENLIRQPLGLASLSVESAGGGGEEGSTKVLIVPITKKGSIPTILESHLPGYYLNPSFEVAPRRAISRYMIRGLVLVFLIAIALTLLLWTWGALALLLMLPAAYWAFLNYKDVGWNISEGQLSLRYRKIVRNTVFLRKNKIQMIRIRESVLQKKKQLSTIEAVNKSGTGASGGRVVDIDQQDGWFIYNWFSHSTEEKS